MPTVRTFVIVLAALALSPFAVADDWPQWRGPKRDGVWRETGIVEKLPATVKPKWSAEVALGYAGPAVADGRVYVPDFKLDAGEALPGNPFRAEPIRGTERVHCFDEKTGDVIWSHAYPVTYKVSYAGGPRVTPTVADGKVYFIGAMGHAWCLDAAKGNMIWKKDFVADFGTEIPMWGMSAPPLVDGEQVIMLVGGRDGAGVVAFDKDSGKERWRALEFRNPGYCPPVIIEAGGARQLIIWSPEAVTSLNPATGDVFWSYDFAVRSGLSIATPVYDAKRRLLLVTSFYNGSRMLKLAADRPAAELLWQGNRNSEQDTDKLHGLMCTPVMHGGQIYGVCSYGQLRGLDLMTGERKWETFKATGEDRWWNAFIVKHGDEGDRYVLFNEQGELIFASLTAEGYEEHSRTKIIEPQNPVRRRQVAWVHPAFANKCVYIRNNERVVCVDLSK